MKAITARFDGDIDVVAVGGRSGLLWSQSDTSLAGIGEAKRLPFSRPNGAEEATKQLAAMIGSSEVDGPGTGPVAFAALPFNPATAGELIIPEIVVGEDSNGRRWITVLSEEDDNTSRAGRITAALTRVHNFVGEAENSHTEPSEYQILSAMEPSQWRDDVVAAARNRIASGELTKAVLARQLTVACDAPIDIAKVVRRLVDEFPTAMVFNVHGFVGASPELLVSRQSDSVRAHPLAGTAARSSDPATDSHLVAQLLVSAKDRWEHQITIDWLIKTLLPFCSYVDAEPEPSVVTLTNVHHLGTLVEGRLSSPTPSVLELVSALHPTPAVGGDPQLPALELIASLEPGGRGRYAGPTGWVDAAGNGAFAVAIRSAEIVENQASLFAGVGVVQDSDPASELEETRNKFRAMLGALVRP